MIKIINDKTIVQYILFYYEDYQVLYLVFEHKAIHYMKHSII